MQLVKRIFLHSFSFESFNWLLKPEKTALLFAFRTIIASYIALTIALWMEMDSPRWAIMAVWVVSQNSSRGEIRSKANWVIFGNILGIIASLTIIACFPQQPFLFEIAVALWVSLCCWFASCTRNFLGFGWAMAGFSCAIILFSSVNDPNTTFMMAMSRGSYFILGILAESFTARLFDLNIHHLAHKKLNQDLKTSLEATLQSMTKMLDGNDWAASRSDQLLSSTINLNNTIEFRELEMQGSGITGDYARATLSSMSAILVKTTEFSIHYKQLRKETMDFPAILPAVKEAFNHLLHNLHHNEALDQPLQSINNLRWECRQKISDSFYFELQQQHKPTPEILQKYANDRILYQNIREILAESEQTFLNFQQSLHIKNKSHFKFKNKTTYDTKRAWRNSIRALFAITIGFILWHITAWSQAPTFLSFLCMGCARFCMLDNLSTACYGWLKGICIAIIVTFFYNFIVMPAIGAIHILYILLLPPLFIGALAMCIPKYAAISSAYLFFFCYLLGFENSGRVDEVTFFNTSLALFMSGIVSFVAYRTLFPYRSRKLRRQLRQKLLLATQNLAKTRKLPKANTWIHFVSQSFGTLMRQLNEDKNTTLIQTYRHGSMAVMIIGIHILRLRSMINHDIVSPDIKNILRVVLRNIAHFKGHKAQYSTHTRTVIIIHSAISRLKHRAINEKNLSIRMEISIAISSLILIAYALDKNASFLRVSK